MILIIGIVKNDCFVHTIVQYVNIILYKHILLRLESKIKVKIWTK